MADPCLISLKLHTRNYKSYIEKGSELAMCYLRISGLWRAVSYLTVNWVGKGNVFNLKYYIFGDRPSFMYTWSNLIKRTNVPAFTCFEKSYTHTIRYTLLISEEKLILVQIDLIMISGPRCGLFLVSSHGF